MKPTPTTATPAIKYIDGQPFVRVIDLGHQWHTNTSNILAIGKRHHVPEEQLRRIDGRVWCSFQGLRYRVQATKHGSSIAGRIREFLDAQAEKTEPKQAQATEPAATDLGIAALIADARHAASQALAKAEGAAKTAEDGYDIACRQRARANLHDENIRINTNNISVALERIAALKESDEKTQKFIKAADANAYDYVLRAEALEKSMDAAKLAVKSAANIAEKASEAVDRVKTTAQHAADLAQKNADIITVTNGRISLRLDRLSEHVDCVEQNVIADARRTASQALKEAHSNTKLIFEHTERLYKLENTVEKLKPCRDHVARHQSASATVVSDKNTARINDLTTRVHDLDVRVKALEHDVPQLLHAMCPKERVQELSGKLDSLADVVDDNQTEITNAKSFLNNLDHRTADTAARIGTLEEHAHAVDWTLAAVAILGVVGHVIRLLRRR